MRRPITTTLPMHRADRAREAAKAMRFVEKSIGFAREAHAAAQSAEKDSGAWSDYTARARIAAALVDLRRIRRELMAVAAKGWRR